MIDTASPVVTAETVTEALKQVFDPEIGLNIVDLGLVYDVSVCCDLVRIQMTLTSQGCPLHELILQGVERAVLAILGVKRVQVELTWDPPWHPAMMSREASELLARNGVSIW